MILNEVDILVDHGTTLDAIEVKSAMTFSPSFEKALKKVGTWVNTPINHRTVVYAGTLEDEKSDIHLLNYLHLT